MSANARDESLSARLLLAALWLFHWLPLGVQAAIGSAVGRAGWHLVASRRKVALRNLELCFPELGAGERVRLAREHFRWLGEAELEVAQGDLAARRHEMPAEAAHGAADRGLHAQRQPVEQPQGRQQQARAQAPVFRIR